MGAGGSGQWWGLLHPTRTERAPVSTPAEFLQLKSFFETWLCVNADTWLIFWYTVLVGGPHGERRHLIPVWQWGVIGAVLGFCKTNGSFRVCFAWWKFILNIIYYAINALIWPQFTQAMATAHCWKSFCATFGPLNNSLRNVRWAFLTNYSPRGKNRWDSGGSSVP